MNALRHGLQIGAVVIGRNEEQRLEAGLESFLGNVELIIYVDSGSTDNSLQLAKSLDVETISLDMTIPFTAARARNKGAEFLFEKNPNIKYIQFIDGDCEVQTDWIKKASEFLENNTEYAVVCGRRRERYPEKSVYNQLCDIEWNTPIGDALACGGDLLIRSDAFKQIDGYKNHVIAAEDNEMCFRIREKGWKIRRIDEEMTLHDAAMYSFSQWWKRATRAGYAYANGCVLHGKSKERYMVRENIRILVWGIFLPLLIFVLALINPLFLLLSLIYPLQIIRIGLTRSDVENIKYSWAASTVAGKIPEAIGFLRFWSDKLKNRTAQIIEYK